MYFVRVLIAVFEQPYATMLRCPTKLVGFQDGA
jgi:hypothetical protein